VMLSSGEEFDSNLIVWTTSNAANPIVARHTDIPFDQRGFLLVRADLLIGTDTAPVPSGDVFSFWVAPESSAILPESLFLKGLAESLLMIRPGVVDICVR
jgi:NADH:ubiquinone reductase (H+-translocating)